jgi:hypothetical protein
MLRPHWPTAVTRLERVPLYHEEALGLRGVLELVSRQLYRILWGDPLVPSATRVNRFALAAPVEWDGGVGARWRSRSSDPAVAGISEPSLVYDHGDGMDDDHT